MTLDEVMQELKAMGSEQTKKIFTRHGAREPFFGVKVGDLKKIVKKVKKDHELSLALYQTGNSDAMNGFVIAVGSYVESLTERAIEIGKMNGKVEVEMGGAACKVPSAPEYIQKVQNRGTIWKEEESSQVLSLKSHTFSLKTRRLN